MSRNIGSFNMIQTKSSTSWNYTMMTPEHSSHKTLVLWPHIMLYETETFTAYWNLFRHFENFLKSSKGETFALLFVLF